MASTLKKQLNSMRSLVCGGGDGGGRVGIQVSMQPMERVEGCLNAANLVSIKFTQSACSGRMRRRISAATIMSRRIR